MKRLFIALLAVVALVACETSDNPVSPTQDGADSNTNSASSTNDNANTNNIDINVPIVINNNPTPTPDRTTGDPDPVVDPGDDVVAPPNRAALVAQLAADNLIALHACGEDYEFLDIVVEALQAEDPRWGYFENASGTLSNDSVGYYNPVGDPWKIDIVVNCGTDGQEVAGWQETDHVGGTWHADRLSFGDLTLVWGI